MKVWECTKCKKERYCIEELVMKVCNGCQVEMEINEVIHGNS